MNDEQQPQDAPQSKIIKLGLVEYMLILLLIAGVILFILALLGPAMGAPQGNIINEL